MTTDTSNIFLSSDYHFGHDNLYKQRHEGESLVRPEFSSSAEADEIIIERHNSIVRPNDRVYILGDICFHKSHLHKLGRMNGKKVLIKGNHDTCSLKEYQRYVEDIRGASCLRRIPNGRNVIMTHIPIHTQELDRYILNPHGHTHNTLVMNTVSGLPDPRYFCVCLEQNNYYPVPVEKLVERLKSL